MRYVASLLPQTAKEATGLQAVIRQRGKAWGRFERKRTTKEKRLKRKEEEKKKKRKRKEACLDRPHTENALLGLVNSDRGGCGLEGGQCIARTGRAPFSILFVVFFLSHLLLDAYAFD